MDWIDIGKEIPWLGRDIIYLVDRTAERSVTEELNRLNFKIVFLDGEKITGDDSFFLEIANALNFPDYFGKNWNAFNDSFGDLNASPQNRLAIIWQQASVCLHTNLNEFLRIIINLYNAASGSGSVWVDDSERIQVELFLLGDPPQFNKRP